MTEAEWLACCDPEAMLAWLGSGVSGRKLRLFACACCRTEWDRIEEEDARKAIAAAERYADGLIRDGTVTGWYRRTMHARDRVRGQDLGKRLLYQAVIEAALPDQDLERVAAAYDLVGRAAASFETGSDFRTPPPPAAVGRAIASFVPLLRDVVGNPFRPAALDPAAVTPAVVSLARASYDERLLPGGHLDPARLAVLSDALGEAGCTDADLLSHLRSPGPHIRGCWALDLILGKR